MFTNLTSYFWGGGSGAAPTEEVGAPSTVTPSPLVEGVPAIRPDDLVVVSGVKELEAVGSSSLDVAGADEEDWLMVDSHLSAGELRFGMICGWLPGK